MESVRVQDQDRLCGLRLAVIANSDVYQMHPASARPLSIRIRGELAIATSSLLGSDRID